MPKYELTLHSTCHICKPRLHLWWPPLAHSDKSLIFRNHLRHVSRLEMHVSVCVIHRPLFLVTFHLSCYIGVRYRPPALSLCVCGSNELRVLTGFVWMWLWFSLSVPAERSNRTQHGWLCLACLHYVIFSIVRMNRDNHIIPVWILG